MLKAKLRASEGAREAAEQRAEGAEMAAEARDGPRLSCFWVAPCERKLLLLHGAAAAAKAAASSGRSRISCRSKQPAELASQQCTAGIYVPTWSLCCVQRMAQARRLCER